MIIPWHVGSIVDETEESRIDLGLIYWQLEAEANRFASELLMPSDWAGDILARAKDPISGAESISQIAEVSFEAAMIKAQNLFQKGYVFAEDGKLISSGRTTGTFASMPRVGSAQAAEMFPHAAKHWIKSTGTEDYHVWRFADETPMVPSTRACAKFLTKFPMTLAFPPPSEASSSSALWQS